MSALEKIHAREILDSRGNPTVQAEVHTAAGHVGIARVPSGSSTGSQEAWELCDADPARYRGKGKLRAVRNVKERIAPRLRGIEISEQRTIDQAMIELDGTEDKRELGANAILAVSLAVARAAAAENGMELFEWLGKESAAPRQLPVPMMNLINGGVHANNNIDLQEFMVLPVGASSMHEAVRYGAEVFYALRDVLEARGYATAVGDEGGFSPALSSNEAGLELLMEAVQKAGLRAPEDVLLGLDMASSEFYRDGRYRLRAEQRELQSAELSDLLAEWVQSYPIITVEDAMAEDDWEGWRQLTRRLGRRLQLVGDDLFVTNTRLLRRGIEEKAANSILIKLNQIGTLSETLEAVRLARENGYTIVISHRSGETADTTIADLAVGIGAGQIKTGSLCRSERVEKYNRLTWIEDMLGAQAEYAGTRSFANFDLAACASPVVAPGQARELGG